jgi:hypothetical protein
MKRTMGGLVLAALTGCGGGGDDGTALEGIYVIAEWTRNDAGCAQMGPSILPQPEMALYIKHENFLGTKFVNGVRCVDVAECEEQAADDETIYIDAYAFDEGDDDAGWSGYNFSDDIIDDGDCVGELHEYLLRGTPGTSITIETYTYPVGGFPEDADGWCDTDEARDAAEGLPCTSNEVVGADFASELP